MLFQSAPAHILRLLLLSTALVLVPTIAERLWLFQKGQQALKEVRELVETEHELLVVGVPLLIRLFLLVVGGVVHDVRDPGKEHVDELAVHQDLDRTVEHFAEDVLVKLARADSCFTHKTD